MLEKLVSKETLLNYIFNWMCNHDDPHVIPFSKRFETICVFIALCGHSVPAKSSPSIKLNVMKTVISFNMCKWFMVIQSEKTG